ncbi:MAG: YhcH/YjgK/YiaL family protein [Bacteroidaceae bacterium]|nr:YhcH/YjgK/YiaL family protein [Bacteroidaceae bacterium]
MNKLILSIALAMASIAINAQTYTNEYPKDIQKLAAKWVKKGEWKNGFTKAVPAPSVNLVEFYIQYHRNPEEWKALFRWLQENDLLTVPAGRIPIEGTNLTVSVEDSENWCSQADLKAGKGSESHHQKIDFMYVVHGTEGFARLDHDTSTANPYNADKDRKDYKFDANRLEQFNSIPGTFNIMFPCDWHVAKVKTQEASQKLRVLVIKVNYKL